MPKSSVDVKGRMNFPCKLREELGEVFVITKTLGEKCIKVYSKKDWDELVLKIRAMPQTQTADIQRFLFGDKQEIEPDKQGRFVIPAELRDYAEIETESEAVVLGLEGRAEIWSAANWNKKLNSPSMENLTDIAITLGI